MGTTKYQIYTQEQIEMARLFKALAHPARLAIVENILKSENLCGKDLQEHIDLSQSTISQHLKELFVTGVIDVYAAGNRTIYRLNKVVTLEIKKCINRFIAKCNTKKCSDLFVPFRDFKPIHYPNFKRISTS